MPAPTIPQLGGSTVNRKWILEVDLNDGVGTANYTPVGGITNFQPNTDNANWVDDSDFAGAGFESQTKTSAGWTCNATVRRAPQLSNPTAYDVGQEFLRQKAEGVFGPANSAHVRVYEYDPNDPNGIYSPRSQAYAGVAGVGWAEAGGDNKATSTVTVTLNGQGKLLSIVHPYPVGPTVPTISTIAPTALSTAGGQAVVIHGHGFTGTTGASHVTFGGTNATSYTVNSDTEIVAVAPAHAAGTVPVVVTNPTGASTTGPSVVYS